MMETNEEQPPVTPLPEPERPILYECLHNHQVHLNSRNGSIFDASTGNADIVRKDDAEQAYFIDHSMETIDLMHHGPGWGRIFFAFRYPRITKGMFRKPTVDGETPERVAIKCLNINAVEIALRQGSMEDPYREINRMQTIGDNIHVLKCIEALRDEENIYIVMPYCQDSLMDHEPLSERDAFTTFGQILDCLSYLRQHQICHRNLSPRSFLRYQARVVLCGLARSFQLPPGPSSVVIPDTHIHGKPAFQPPEVFSSSHYGFPYDVYQCDLWAAGLTLFSLLTNETFLYHIPYHSDLMFRCFFLARGITGIYNELIQECLEDADVILLQAEDGNDNNEEGDGQQQDRLRQDAARIRQVLRMRPVFTAIQNLSPEVREILDYLFKVPPDERWNLDMVRPPTLNLINR